MSLSLSTARVARAPSDVARDKPQNDRAEHANLDHRPGAHLHPNARHPAHDAGKAPREGWQAHREAGWPAHLQRASAGAGRH